MYKNSSATRHIKYLIEKNKSLIRVNNMYLQYMKMFNFIIKFVLYYKLFLWCDFVIQSDFVYEYMINLKSKSFIIHLENYELYHVHGQ